MRVLSAQTTAEAEVYTLSVQPVERSFSHHEEEEKHEEEHNPPAQEQRNALTLVDWTSSGLPPFCRTRAFP